MDYSKMGGARGGSNAPRYDRHKDAGAGKPAAGGKKATKAELLERMKQAQQKRKES